MRDPRSQKVPGKKRLLEQREQLTKKSIKAAEFNWELPP